MENLEVKVLKKRLEAEGITSFELVRTDDRPLPAFSAGSHIEVQIPGGLTRQYSLYNDSGEQHRYRIAVLREPASRGGSIKMHDAVNEGDVIYISAPHNHFPLQQAKHTLLLAGGIGVTPLLCMAQRMDAIGNDFAMHYCSRSTERMAFREDISASNFASKVSFHFDAGEPDQQLDLETLLAKPDAGTHIYVCGPSGFIDFVVNTAKAKGWNKDQVHFEYFGAGPQDKSGDGNFEVKIASTGKIYPIAANTSVTEALKVHGIEILTSCEQGVCGTCITRVLEGEPDHRDMYFTDKEHAKNDQFTPCCSRSKSAMLVLDL